MSAGVSGALFQHEDQRLASSAARLCQKGHTAARTTRARGVQIRDGRVKTLLFRSDGKRLKMYIMSMRELVVAYKIAVEVAVNTENFRSIMLIIFAISIIISNFAADM